MTTINQTLMKLAERIANQLYSMDNNGCETFDKDSRKNYIIDKWGVKEINKCITIFNGKMPVAVYLNRHANAGECKPQDIGERWLQSLMEVSEDKPVTTEEKSNKDSVEKIPGPNISKVEEEQKFEPAKIYTTVEQKNVNSDIKFPEGEIDPELYAQAVDNLIRKARGQKTDSVMIGTGQYYYQTATANNVDPFTLTAISMLESGYGTSSIAKRNSNPCGITPDGKNGRDYSGTGVSKAISDSALYLSRNAQKYNTIMQVGLKGNYCCPNVKKYGYEGAMKIRRRWANSISSIANDLRMEYNHLLELKNKNLFS